MGWKLDRLGRSLRHLVDTVSGLAARGVGFRSLQEAIDTATPGGKLVFHVFTTLAMVAEFCVISTGRDAALPMWGLLPDAVSTGRGRPVCGWSRNVTAALSVESSCSTMRATKSV